MNRYVLGAALGSTLLALSACGDPETDTVVTDEVGAIDTAGATPAAPVDWPAGTRIVEDGGVTYRVDPAGARVAIEDGSWRIVTEGETRYRVSPEGARIRIDDEGLDLEGAASGPDIPGVDVDVGTNTQGNLDVDVSTDGTDASDDQVRDDR
jgi:hypothetical protein